jgi:hypothetical protein
MELFLGFQFVPFIYVSVFRPLSYCFRNYRVIICFEVRYGDASIAFPFFCKIGEQMGDMGPAWGVFNTSVKVEEVVKG